MIKQLVSVFLKFHRKCLIHQNTSYRPEYALHRSSWCSLKSLCCLIGEELVHWDVHDIMIMLEQEVKNASWSKFSFLSISLSAWLAPFLSLSLALEGVLLIRAVSPATPQGSVSQPDTDTHTKSSLVCQVPPHMLTFIISRAHLHTDVHSFIFLVFWHFVPGGERLKNAPLSHPLNPPLPSDFPCHLYLRLPPPLTLSLAALLSWQLKWW